MNFVVHYGKHGLFIVLMVLCCIPVVGFGQSYQQPSQNHQESETVVVHHKVKGSNVFVECLIPNFTFDDRKETSEHKGYIDVYLNGKKYQTEHKAAFIVQGLPEGKHMLRLDIMRPDGGRYLSLKELKVTIK
ncbi:hypothetical protein [Alkalihalobacillus sp. CinArs1]|uniref:hypothetical protein n=1 Tax=Alkalihalobacillus sp. CinArs1 TaxID=2995314 RepID=UPI0022DDD4E2|nr:hypothetical protein [Alkalihalobacillus sp. CinArs1]